MTPTERTSDDETSTSKFSDIATVQNPRRDFVRGSELYDPVYGELIDWDWAQMQPTNGGDR